MIKNYIFDFGNVICEFYEDRLSAPYAENDEEKRIISDVAFDRLYWDRLDNGTISDDEVKSSIKKRLKEPVATRACEAFDNWIFNLTPVPGMQNLIKELKNKGAKLYLISNISIGFAQNYHKSEWINEILSCFDGLILSGTINLVKPDKAIFEYALNKYNLKACECIFIDDNITNTRSAEKLGIKTYHFDGNAEKLREFLIK